MSSYGLHHPTRVNYTWATLITPACSQEITLPFWNRLCFARGNSCAPDIKASPTFQEDINQKTKPSKKCLWSHHTLNQSALLVLQ